MTIRTILRLSSAAGLLISATNRAAAGPIRLMSDALVIIARPDVSGEHAVMAWPKEWPSLDARPISSDSERAYILLMSEQTMRQGGVRPDVLSKGGPVWFKDENWRLAYYVLLPDQSINDIIAEEKRNRTSTGGADVKRRVRRSPVPHPDQEELFARALHHQMDRQFTEAILDYDQLLSKGLLTELASRLMMQCIESMIQDELKAAALQSDSPAEVKRALDEPGLCFNECPSTDINWRQDAPNS